MEGSAWKGIDITGWKITCSISDCNKVVFATGFLGTREGKLCYDAAGDKYYIIAKTGTCGTGHQDLGTIQYWGLDATFASGLGFVAPYITKVGSTYYLVAEYEAMLLSFCGAGCCGGQYKAGINVYWANFWTVTTTAPVTLTPATPTLFGLNRIAFTASIPIMSNFAFNIDFSYSLLDAVTNLSAGWTFTF
jgi:hypothetical protein